MNILLGPAGTPGKSTIDGLAKIKELGLQAMEVQFSHGIGMGIDLSKRIAEENKKHKVKLSVHAPYYINLASKEKAKLEASKKRIIDSCERAHYMGADPVVFHPAYFGVMDALKIRREKVYQTTKEAIAEIIDVIKENKWNTRIAPETTGKHSALGSLDETIQLVKETGCFLCVDVAHLFARGYGKLDFQEMFDKLKTLNKSHLHFHFSGIEYTAKGEKKHVVLGKSGPSFKKFAETLLKQKWLKSATIISESPITWKDSLKMKEILEKWDINSKDF